MSTEIPFTKDNLDLYLKELAKEYRKRGRGVHAELILIGGASVLVNYGFRDLTYDIDAIYTASSVMKEAVNAVGDRLGLLNGWLNTDFVRTDSYSPHLAEYSVYYRTYSNVLEIRTIQAEYLLAMKLVSARRYKKDLSDIVGILYEQKCAGKSLSYEQIDKAVINLYGDWSRISNFAKEQLMTALKSSDLEQLFLEWSEDEMAAKAALLSIEKKYPAAIREDNVDDIVEKALAKKKKAKSREER